jgi:hypothetical protein
MMNKATEIKKYVTINFYQEKVEQRTYANKRVRWYIFQGKRWYQIDAYLVDKYLADGTIILDEGREAYIKHKLERGLL